MHYNIYRFLITSKIGCWACFIALYFLKACSIWSHFSLGSNSHYRTTFASNSYLLIVSKVDIG